MFSFFSPLRFAFKGWYGLVTIAIIVLYLFFTPFFSNIDLITIELTTSPSLSFSLSFLFQFFLGTLQVLSPLELFFTLLNALLLSMTVSLIIQSIRLLSKQRSLSLTVGGTSLVALVGTGCASCGISLLSILGITSAVIPFHGLSLMVLSTLLLSLSLFVILKNKEVVCRLT